MASVAPSVIHPHQLKRSIILISHLFFSIEGRFFVFIQFRSQSLFVFIVCFLKIKNYPSFFSCKLYLVYKITNKLILSFFGNSSEFFLVFFCSFKYYPYFLFLFYKSIYF